MMNRIKKVILRTITFLLRLVKRNTIKSTVPYLIFDSGRTQTFFGYYDKSPFKIKKKKILALAGDIPNRPCATPKKMQIGYFNIDQPEEYHIVGGTSTWCWQQGCRLMWHPVAADSIIYNTIIDNKYGAVIQNINNKRITQSFNFPVYDIDNKGRFALSLNFSRLQRLRPGYGYINMPDRTKNEFYPENDGIFLCDLEKNKSELIIDYKTLYSLKTQRSMQGAQHYVNHLCFNPSSKRFLFFHLWMKDGKRYSRGITADRDGKNMFIVNDRGFVSHYAWKNDREILIFSSINNVMKYYLFTDKKEKKEIIGDMILKSDGHPTYFNDKSRILTDTYPDKFTREQFIIIYDITCNKANKLARIFSPYDFIGEVRCDLHPRLSHNNRLICVDTPFKKGRNILVFYI